MSIDLTRLVDPTVAELYLLANGWEAARRTPVFSTWTRQDIADSVLFLPLSRVPDDYAERLGQFVDRLARIEGTDPDTMTTNLRYAASDLVRVRLVSPRVGPGELPITDGAKLFDGTRNLIQAAACAAVQPRPSYGSKKPGTVTEYLDHVRLGQTEAGSYVVTVVTDVEAEEQVALLPDEAKHLQVPFERRVTNQLMTAVGATRESATRVLAGEPIKVFEDAVESGVSANLCDALTLMGAESSSSKVEVSVEWAVSRRPTIDQRLVTVAPEILPVLSDASQRLKQLGPFDDVEVVGNVEILRRAAEDEVGLVVIDGVALDKKRRVRVELSDAQYRAALQAHDDKRIVSIRGTLVKERKSWKLLDPGPIRVEG